MNRPGGGEDAWPQRDNEYSPRQLSGQAARLATLRCARNARVARHQVIEYLVAALCHHSWLGAVATCCGAKRSKILDSEQIAELKRQIVEGDRKAQATRDVGISRVNLYR